MTVKSEVLRLLESHRTEYISGEKIAESLGVSRAAVWKAIHALTDDGYNIEGISRKGYILKEESTLLSKEAIKLHSSNDYPVHIYDTLDSTNRQAQKLAMDGAPHGTLVIAESQTEGRGRLGRTFFSPKGSGIYMSVIIKPTFDMSESVLITAATSVAVAKAIEEVCGVSSDIKWVNDIYIDGKKVCGILCQAITDFESGQIGNIIVGIGINCTTEAFPEEIADIAGCIPGSFSRNQLIAAVLDNLLSICDNIEDRTFIPYYRSHSMVIGKEINVIPRDEPPVPAKALDIDDNGGLIIEYEDGTRTVLTTGEVSIRIR